MARKQTSQHKRQQRALQKRVKRKQKLDRKRAQEPVKDTPRRLLRRSRLMPLEGAWVQRDWQQQGEARVLVARAQPSDDLLIANFAVDFLCTGVRLSSYAANVDRDTFWKESLPRLYDGEPPSTISEAIANEIIWGSVEYADNLGFRPTSSFRETQYILQPDGVLPTSGTIEFGFDGRPVYIPYSHDNQLAIIRRLIDAVGPDGFAYVPRGEIPDEVVDLIPRREVQDIDIQDKLWVPDMGLDDTDQQSGLWLPGQDSEPDEADDEREEKSLWVPGRT